MPFPLRELIINQSLPSTLRKLANPGQISINKPIASLASASDREILEDFATFRQTSSNATAFLWRLIADMLELGEGGATGANSLTRNMNKRDNLEQVEDTHM